MTSEAELNGLDHLFEAAKDVEIHKKLTIQPSALVQEKKKRF